MNAEEVKPPELHITGRRASFLYWSCFLVGCGMLLPWSAQLSAVDYFKDNYPDHDAMRWIAVCYLPSTILTALLNNVMPPKKLGHGRVMLGFLVASLMLLFIPISEWSLVHDEEGKETTFLLLLISVAVLGTSSGIIDSAFSGLAAYLPFSYYQAYVRGWGFSALISVIIRIMAKAAFEGSGNNLRLGAWIFYLASSLICWTCMLIHRWIIAPHPVWAENLKADEEQPLLHDSHSSDAAPRSLWMRVADSQVSKIAQKVGVANFGMFLTMFAQSAIFPGILTDVECEALGSWYEVLLVLFNALPSFLIRWLPRSGFTKRKGCLMALVFARCLLIPLAFFAVHYYSNPFVIASIVTALGTSQGYLVLCSFGIGQMGLEGRSEALIGGSLLSFFFKLGLCIGSFVSLAWMLF